MSFYLFGKPSPQELSERIFTMLEKDRYSSSLKSIAKTVTAYVKDGADLTLRSRRNLTPLAALMMRLSEDPAAVCAVAKEMMAAGADIDARGFYGRTPLMLVAAQLSDLTASLNAKSMHDAPALKEMFHLLLTSGANVQAQAENGGTALTSLKGTGRYALADWQYTQLLPEINALETSLGVALTTAPEKPQPPKKSASDEAFDKACDVATKGTPEEVSALMLSKPAILAPTFAGLGRCVSGARAEAFNNTLKQIGGEYSASNLKDVLTALDDEQWFNRDGDNRRNIRKKLFSAASDAYVEKGNGVNLAVIAAVTKTADLVKPAADLILQSKNPAKVIKDVLGSVAAEKRAAILSEALVTTMQKVFEKEGAKTMKSLVKAGAVMDGNQLVRVFNHSASRTTWINAVADAGLALPQLIDTMESRDSYYHRHEIELLKAIFAERKSEEASKTIVRLEKKVDTLTTKLEALAKTVNRQQPPANTGP